MHIEVLKDYTNIIFSYALKYLYEQIWEYMERDEQKSDNIQVAIYARVIIVSFFLNVWIFS